MHRRLECVLDANVYIDLNWAGLIPALVRLPYEFSMVDLAREEAVIPTAVPESDQVRVETLSPAQVLELYTLRQQRGTSGLSVEDLASFLLARDLRGVLLTNERPLTRFAARHGVEVHGSLWVLDQLVAAGLVTRRGACDALVTMANYGAWYPKDEYERRLRDWRR